MPQRVEPLRDGDVELWLAQPGHAAHAARALEPVLSDEECERARSFRFARDRREYVLAHALLRGALARHVEADPAALAFAGDRHGRPTLVGAPDWLDFNLSHTRGLVVIAVSRAAAVGVDAEHLEPHRDYDEVAERHFAQAELRALRALPDPDRHRRFLQLWTLKEAYAKACGAGLDMPLDGVAFTVQPGGEVCATFEEADRTSASWRFALLHPTGAHAVAVARRGAWALRPRPAPDPGPILGAAARVFLLT